jgi:rubrerythrin
MYASDILSQCNTVRKKLDALDQNDFHFWFKKWVGGWDGALSAKTSAEAELTQGIWWVLDDYSDDDRLIRCDDCGTLYSFTHYDGVCPDCGKTVK